VKRISFARSAKTLLFQELLVTGTLPVDFRADYGFDPTLFALAVELNCPKHVAMIGKGNGAVAEFLGLFDEITDAYRAIEERILAMNVQMHEI